MATSRLRTYKDLLTSSSDIENWFQKFRYHLLEQELIVPVAENPENPSANETTAINAMQKKIVIHLINSMDTEMFTKLKTLVAPNDPIDQTIESIEKTLVAHLAPKPTILSERHTFYLLKQKSGEDTGHYVTKLREQAIKCKFEEAQLNERIRDQFVVGISCLEAREVLLSENVTDLTLELAFQKTVAVERSRKEAQNLGTSNTINQIRDFRSKSAKKQLQCEKCGKKGHTGTNCKVRCYYCNGYGHIKPNCPERKKDKPVSKSSYSKPYGGNSSRSRDNVQFKRTMNQNTYLLEDSNGESYCIGSTDDDFFDVMNVDLQNLQHDLSILDNFDNSKNNLCESQFEHDVNILNNDNLSSVCVPLEFSADVNAISSKPLVDIEINNQRFVMEIDSGASVSVCSKSALDRANIKYSVRQCNTKLNVANGQKIDVLGKALVCVKVKEICKSDLELYIVDSEFPALFGRSWISEFCGNDWLDRLLSGIKCEKPVKCVTPAENLSSSCVDVCKFDDSSGDKRLRSVPELLQSRVFEEGLGLVKGVKIRLKLRDDARPISEPTRRVPFAIKDKLEVEYKRLTDQGVLVDVKESLWGTPVVPVPKGETVRVCGDYTRTLNKVMDLKQYPLPTIEECFSKVAGGQKFSKIDIRQAFNNLMIAEEDIKLTTLNTHLGQKAWTRIPYGLNNSGAFFQEAIDQILLDIPMVCCRVDDILVSGINDSDHLVNLNRVFSQLELHGLKVRSDKTKLMMDEVIYLGHKISAKGVSPVKSKVDDLLKTPEPRDVKQLIAFLGAVGYYRRYLPDLSTIIAPLDRLRGVKVPWRWTEVEQSAFCKLKALLSSEHVVACYNPQLPVKVESDASAVGLGAVISHIFPDGSEKPIEYASCKLSKSECRYSQIDKEALGIIWAVRRFHYYLYGREFELVTDHMPLTYIFNRSKGISEMSSNRLSRYALILMNYNYKIRYRNTKDHANCDMLSRLPRPGIEENKSDEDAEIFAVKMDDSFIDAKLIARETKRDPILNKVSMWVLDGWPTVKPDNLNTELSAFWERKDYLTLELDCLTWGNRVIIPTSFREAVLQLLHSSHIGVAGMKNVARSFVFWPGIDRDIDLLAKTCEACNKFGKSLPKTPDHPWIRPTKPWMRVHIDFAQFMDIQWLLLFDTFSKWPEVIKMDRTKSADRIRVLRDIFCRFGLPYTLVSDNGPQFISAEFKLFTQNNGIKHIHSPTYSPKSNGSCERLVDSWKRSMKKSYETCKDLDLNNAKFLINYRNTPNSVTGIAPAVRLFNRTLRCRLHQLRPSDRQAMEDMHPERDEKILKSLPSERRFKTSEPVWVQISDDKIWHPATICKEYANSPLYDVSVKGRVIKKHVDRLKHRVVPVIEKQTISDELKQSLRERFAAEEKERKLESYLQRKGLVALEKTPRQTEPTCTPSSSTDPVPGPASGGNTGSDSAPVIVPRRSARLAAKAKV
ncbi:hypothetical protein ACHWQZ_G018395 [Mnemiopsis leidyi]